MLGFLKVFCLLIGFLNDLVLLNDVGFLLIVLGVSFFVDVVVGFVMGLGFVIGVFGLVGVGLVDGLVVLLLGKFFDFWISGIVLRLLGLLVVDVGVLNLVLSDVCFGGL